MLGKRQSGERLGVQASEYAKARCYLCWYLACVEVKTCVEHYDRESLSDILTNDCELANPWHGGAAAGFARFATREYARRTKAR